MSVKILLYAILSLIMLVSSVQAASISINGTQYYEKLDGSMTDIPSIITDTPLGYRIDWRGMYYFTVWDGVNAYDTFNYPNGTFVSPWVFPKIEYWRTTGSKRWVEVIPINNTFEQSGNQIIRRMVMGDNSKFNITYTATDKIKYTWNFTAGANQNYSIVPRMDSAASQDINFTSKRYTPGWFDNRTFYSYGDIQEPYASNVSSWYEAGNRKFYQRIILGQMGIGNSTEIDPSVQFNGSTSPPWQNGSNYNVIDFEEGTTLTLLPTIYDDFESGMNWTKWKNTTNAIAGVSVTNGELTLTTNATIPGVNFSGLIYNSIPYSVGSNITAKVKSVETTYRHGTVISDANEEVIIASGIQPANNRLYTTYRSALSVLSTSFYDGTTIAGGTYYITIANYVSLASATSNFFWTNGTSITSFNNNPWDSSNPTNAGIGNTVPGASLQGVYEWVHNDIYPVSGNRTQWHVFGAGRQGANLMFNFTNSSTTFVDVYASTDNFTTSNVFVVSNITNATWVAIPTSAKNQTQYIRAVLKGNTINTSGLIEISIDDEAVSGGGAPDGAIPPDPINLAQTNSSTGFWINYTWQNGSGNITNSYNVSVNGTWTNGSANNFSNGTVSAHGWRNITVWAFNNSGNGNLSTGNVTLNTQIPNNAPVQSSIGNKNVNEGSWLNFTISSSDADGDALTYDSNKTKGTLTTNSYSWTPTYSDSGTYIWYFNTTDNYSAVATETITVTVNNINQIPPVPLINSTKTGNFFVNTSWIVGSGNVTDGYNSTNSTTWINSTSTFRNTTLSSHAWQNLTIYAWNSTDNVLSLAALTNNTQIPNNAPVLDAIGNKNADEGTWLNFTVSGTDLDGDSLTCATNATKGTFSNCNFNWSISYSDAGTYYWNYNGSDGYGGLDDETITITVNNVDTNTTPLISNVVNGSVGDTWGIVNFTVNQSNALTQIKYGIDESLSSQTTNQSTGTDRSVNITGLNNDTKYYYSVFAYNVSNTSKWSNSSIKNFTTNSNVTVTVNAPNITSWENNKTVNQSTRIDLFNLTTIINFNITVNQSITLYRWYLNGTNMSNNYDNWSYPFIYNNTQNIITANASNDNGTSQTITWYVNVSVPYEPEPTYMPPTPVSCSATTGNFWINTSCSVGTGNITNSMNKTNATIWSNNTNFWMNNTLSPHEWDNISFYAFNNSGTGTSNQTPATLTTQIPNNIPVLSSIGNKNVNENQLLSFSLTGSDDDSDAITCGTNATKGTLTSCDYSWTPNYTESGNYVFIYYYNDSYGGSDSEIITITVNNIPLNISSFLPASDPSSIQGTSQAFNVTLNRTANVTWLINGTQVQYNSSVTIANYSNNTAGILASYNVTASVNESVSTDNDYHRWNWTVTSVIPAANITSWGNSNTSNNSLTFTIQRNTNVTFNITANQSVTTTWTNGTVSPTKINGTNENISYAYYNFTLAGAFTVIPYCSNANGTCTNTPTWTITVTAIGGLNLTIYVENVLGLPLEKARVDLNISNFMFTGANGYANFSNVNEAEYTILVRAIPSYRNSTNTTTISSNTIVNFTMQEKGNVASPQTSGFTSIITIINITILILINRRKKWK